jgi:putative endonuclease
MRSGHWVYLVRCADGSYYCGYARDPVARVKEHNLGKGAKILRGKLPVRLAYARRLSSRSGALKLEARIKATTHLEKQTLSKRWLHNSASRRLSNQTREIYLRSRVSMRTRSPGLMKRGT